MTFDGVLSWALKAKAGDELVYHKGGQLTNFQNQHDYSDAVWGARYCYNGGLVDLFQRRDGTQFFYTARKRRNIEPPSADAVNPGTHKFAIPYLYYCNSANAHMIDGKWEGARYGQEA
jgi:hypothetical protein